MGLEDFNKINNNINNENDVKDKKVMINGLDLATVEYYVHNIDELISLVESSYVNYINAKLKHDLKKDDLQLNINWNAENAFREGDGLPKITNQNQRDSVIRLKVKPLKLSLEEFELKYNTYKKIFDFISKNFKLLSEMYEPKKECSDKYIINVN